MIVEKYKNQEGIPINSDGTIKYKSNCPNCNRERIYKTKNGFVKGLTKNCRSCSNSLNRGGNGLTEFCSCGNPKYEKSSTLCRECAIKRSNDYHLNIYRFKRHGVTKEWYESQAKCGCAICGKFLSAHSKIKRERGHIDHDHKTGKVRELLCDKCNMGLGQFRDSIEIL